MLEALGRFVVARRVIVLIGWTILVGLGAVFGGAVFDGTSALEDSPAGSESAEVAARLDDLDQEGPVVTAVIRGTDFYDPALVDGAGAVLREIRALPGVVEVTDAYTSGGIIGDDGRSSLVVVEIDPALSDADATGIADDVADRLHMITPAEVLVGGELLSERAFIDAAIEDAGTGEAIAIVLVLVLLTAVLGGILAGLLPVVAALATISGSLLLVSVAMTAVPVNDFAVNIVTLLGLGLAVDYSLLIIMRFRDERETDPAAPVDVLMTRTVATAGRAVLVSGLAIGAALLGMILLGDPLLSGMAIGGAAVVVVASLAGLTLVPALLSLVARHLPGRRAGSWARPWLRVTAARSSSSPSDRHGALGVLGRLAQRRPRLVAVVTTIGLLLLAAPVASLAVGSSDIRSLPASSEERRAYEATTTGFADLGVEPVTVLIDGEIGDPAVIELLDRVAALPDVSDARSIGDLPPAVSVVEFTPVGDATGPAAQALVAQIRELATDPALGVALGVGGPAAEVIDTTEHLAGRLPLVALVLAAATMGLLLALTRSIVVSVKAVLLATLTVASTLGILVAIFQWGWAADLLGLEPWGAVDVTTPLLIGLLSFGLAMDYEVFLLARIHEFWRGRDRSADARASNDRAVLGGIVSTGPVVTTAAVAIVIVFLGFALSDVLALKEIGIGMAVAVIIDVTLIRGLLLPATMTLLAGRNWWAPRRHGLRGSELPPRR